MPSKYLIQYPIFRSANKKPSGLISFEYESEF